MTFRARVLALVVLVAVSATAATAWLTLRQASKQVTKSVTADRRQLELISTQLRHYGFEHGTWTGVHRLVDQLSRSTGQRIRLTTDAGEVVSDASPDPGDPLPLSSMSTVIDPRPTLRVPDWLGRSQAADAVASELGQYRINVRVIACAWDKGIDPHVTENPEYGYPAIGVYLGRNVDGSPGAAEDCYQRPDVQAVIYDPGNAPRAQLRTCVEGSQRGTYQDCLRQRFSRLVEADSAVPAPLRLSLGARDTTRAARLAAGPVLAAAAGVALLAVLSTVLITRRVLRPIRTLTSAARRLGRGDLTSRVGVAGNDEVAELARSFNRMADSLQHGEERQRRLIADVAHELRTPLANLRGYLEAVSDGVVEPDAELLTSLNEEVLLQQRVVDDLQELALAEAGALTYHRTLLDVSDLLEVCSLAHRPAAEAAGVSLTAERGEGVPPVHADPDRLRQVLGNLISNALRATPPGGRITLRAGATGSQVVITVSDTGTGIEPAALTHIFDRFWRADPARGRRTGGSGLGLAIARQIVSDHGGVIEVHSEVGSGTTFTITLPVGSAPKSDTDDDPPGDRCDPAVPAPSRPGRHRRFGRAPTRPSSAQPPSAMPGFRPVAG